MSDEETLVYPAIVTHAPFRALVKRVEELEAKVAQPPDGADLVAAIVAHARMEERKAIADALVPCLGAISANGSWAKMNEALDRLQRGEAP